MIWSVIIIGDRSVLRESKAVRVGTFDKLREDFDFCVIQNRSVNNGGDLEFIGGNDVDTCVLKSPCTINTGVGRALYDLKRT